jgi:uncharacterized damage-inducible protein DinB
VSAPLAEMLRYNRWATATLIDACSALSDEQLDFVGSGTSGSVRELLVHLVGAQQTFVLRTEGRQHEGELNRRSDWPGMAALAELAAESSDQLVEIAASLDGGVTVDLPYMGTVYRYPKSFFLVHAVEHGVEHRTEIKLALAQLGIATPDLDGWSYAAAAGYGERVG